MRNNPDGHFAMGGDDRIGYSIEEYQAEAAGMAISRGPANSQAEIEWLRKYVERREFLTTFAFSN